MYERANGSIGAHGHEGIGRESTDSLEEVQREGGDDEVSLKKALRNVRKIQCD